MEKPASTFETQYAALLRRQRGLLPRILDGLLTFAAAALAALLLLRTLAHPPALWVGCLFFAALASLFRLQWQQWRLCKRAQKKRREYARDHLLERLVLMPEHEFYGLCAAVVEDLPDARILCRTRDGMVAQTGGQRVLMALLQRHPQSQVTPQDILDFHRRMQRTGVTSGVLLCTAAFAPNCQSFIQRGELPIELVRPEELLRLATALGLLPGDAELEAALLGSLQREQAQRKARQKQLPASLLRPELARRYATCGLLILGCGFLFGLQLYYTLCAWGCFALSGLCLALPRLRRRASAVD